MPPTENNGSGNIIYMIHVWALITFSTVVFVVIFDHPNAPPDHFVSMQNVFLGLLFEILQKSMKNTIH